MPPYDGSAAASDSSVRALTKTVSGSREQSRPSLPGSRSPPRRSRRSDHALCIFGVHRRPVDAIHARVDVPLGKVLPHGVQQGQSDSPRASREAPIGSRGRGTGGEAQGLAAAVDSGAPTAAGTPDAAPDATAAVASTTDRVGRMTTSSLPRCPSTPPSTARPDRPAEPTVEAYTLGGTAYDCVSRWVAGVERSRQELDLEQQQVLGHVLLGRHVGDTGERQHGVRPPGGEQRRRESQRVCRHHVVVGETVDEHQRPAERGGRRPAVTSARTPPGRLAGSPRNRSV